MGCSGGKVEEYKFTINEKKVIGQGKFGKVVAAKMIINRKKKKKIVCKIINLDRVDMS